MCPYQFNIFCLMNVDMWHTLASSSTTWFLTWSFLVLHLVTLIHLTISPLRLCLYLSCNELCWFRLCFIPINTYLHISEVTEAAADELPLKDGESYFVVVRATNKLGYVHTIHSDGVTVKLEPLLPGNVRDGDITGKDLNYQPSVTSLSANWDGFGQPQEDSNKPVVSRTLLLNIITLSFSTRQHILSYSSNNLRTVIRLFCSKLV